MARLPLFPLNTVLFPGMPLPLHIFEERYKLMIGRCIEQRAPFGVVLIRSGEEAGEPAEPFDVGTTARIARVQRLDDGRMNLVTLGHERFRIRSRGGDQPYLTGDVELLASEELDAPQAEDEAHRVAALFGEHLRLRLAVSGQWTRAVDLPSEPDRLADFVAAGLDAPQTFKQELLETLSVPERLRREAELLGKQVRELADRWQELRRTKYAGAALN